jgi:multiple sugar transport system substrate-binding protein
MPSSFVKKKISRREALSTTAKVAVGVVVAGVIGGVAGYYVGSTAAPPPVRTETLTKTVTSTQTVTQTVTVTPTITTTPKPTITITTTPTTATTTATTTTTTPKPTITGPITAYAEKGWYPEEEEARKWLAAMFKRETGIELKITSLTQEDVLKKVVAGATAKSPPAIAFCTTLSWMQDYAWNGWIEDLSEFIDILKDLEVPDWAINAWKWADPTRKELILAGVPFCVDNIPFHYWKDFLEEAGMPTDPDEIPMRFKEFSDFWKEAQDRLWQKKPDYKEKVYGIGWPSMGGIGVNPGDGLQQFVHILLWHGWKLEWDSKGILKLDRSENREALRKAVKWFAETYQAGYMPKGILEWGSPDNNKAFHARQIISVHNGTMSIVMYWYGVDKEAYFKKIATLRRFPSETGERGAQTWEVHSWMIFKDAPNKEAAKKFIKWFLQPEIINMYLKTTGGRFIPISRAVLEMDPFWKEGHTDGGKYVDPHLPTAYEMYMKGPNFPNPQHWFKHPWSYLDAYPMQAVHKVVKDGWSVDEAVDWAIKTWLDAMKKYIDEIRKW